MLVMGTNTWERDIPKKALIFQALKFADDVKEKGIAELQGAWIQDANFNDLDMAVSDPVDIALVLRFDQAILQF